MAAAPEKPDYLAEHAKRHKYARMFSDAHKMNSFEGYHTAVKKHLLNDDGLPDFDLLDREDIQSAFVKTMTEFYSKKVEEISKAKPANDFHRNLLMQTYMGFTGEALRDMVGRYGSKLNYDRFAEQAGEFNQQIKQHLYQTATEHVTDRDVGAIAKKLNLEQKLSSPLTTEEAKALLNYWRDYGETLPDEMLRRLIGKKLKRTPAPKKP